MEWFQWMLLIGVGAIALWFIGLGFVLVVYGPATVAPAPELLDAFFSDEVLGVCEHPAEKITHFDGNGTMELSAYLCDCGKTWWPGRDVVPLHAWECRHLMKRVPYGPTDADLLSMGVDVGVTKLAGSDLEKRLQQQRERREESDS